MQVKYKRKITISLTSLILAGWCAFLALGGIKWFPINLSPRCVHLSIDDAECVFDLIENKKNYSSIFDQSFLKYIKSLHDKYGIKVSLYTFASKPQHNASNLSITDLPEKFQREFIANSHWLRVGYHWKEQDFKRTISVCEFSQSYKNVYTTFHHNVDSSAWTCTLRLHYFYAPDSLIKEMEDVKTLLCADSPGRDSYNLNSRELKQLNSNRKFKKNNKTYVPTDIRIEHYPDIRKALLAHTYNDTIVIFSHEWALTPETLRVILAKIIKGKFNINALNRYNLNILLKEFNNNNYEYTFLE